MSDRYQVRSITGYPIAPGKPTNGQKLATTWWVADSDNCYREAMLYRATDGQPTGSCLTHFRTVAEHTAAKLNVEQAAWERDAS